MKLATKLAMLAPTAAGLVGLALPIPASAVLQVQSVTPARYALAVPSYLTEIQAIFSAPVASVPPGAVRVSGTMSGLHDGTVTVVDDAVTFHNGLRPFLRGEMVVVNYRNDIASVTGDSLTGGYTSAFTIASGAGTFAWQDRQGWGASDVPYFIYGGDLDGDGSPDVAAPNEGTHDVSIFRNTGGDGSFPLRQEYAVGQVPSSIFGEDFDNDGDQDLATANIQSGNVSVLLNHGDGTFAPATNYPAGGQCRQIHGGDFDGDNDVDLCATSRGQNRVHVYLNNGDGTFVPLPPITAVSAGPFAIRTGLLDPDGRLDIAVACQDADSLTVLTNQGGGVFARTGTWAMANGPWCLNGNDFDGDGDFDLASVASYANRLIVLFNDGSGGFGTSHLVSTGAFPLGVFVADLDGDGDVDATSSNYAGGTVDLFRNPGNGLLAYATTLPVAQSGSYTWAHDLDGDGDLDLSVVDENADSLFVFFQAGVAAAAPEPPAQQAEVLDGADSGTIRVVPNPVDPRSGARVTITLPDGGRHADDAVPIWVELFSIDGRQVGRVGPASLREGTATVSWDASRLAPGRYVLEVRSRGSRSARGEAIVLPSR
ncbi:MAG: FG-GAP repeat domain-containing protein [Candidatus Eisenbacteria bacterium]